MRRVRRQSGLTLVELLIVVAVLAVIAIIIAPNVVTYLNRARDTSYDSDRSNIQLAVEVFYAELYPLDVTKKYPTFSGERMSASGVPTDTSPGGAYIDFSKIVCGTCQLRDTPRSAGPLNATGVYTGSYSWYVDNGGMVQSNPAKMGGVYP